MTKNLYTLLLLLAFHIALIGQNTVGLLSYDVNQAYQGYTLIYPHNQSTTYLLDNCGEVVHSWTDDEDFRPANTAYLMANGNLVKTKRPSSVAGDPIWAGGGGATIEIRSWDNDLIWTYTLNNETARLHHDISVLPNGNILAVAWELKTNEEAIAAGRDPEALNQENLWPDYIFEISPSTNEIVWEWHVWDHLIQDFDATKDNFGDISAHPELVDINWNFNNGAADWMHANALDYNAELDQIMLSVPHFSEVWVIDHSTTTEQAASHAGGNINHGGDLLYRVGNQQVYQQGDSTDQILFFQHNAHWTNEFLPVGHPNRGKVVCFNNRVGADFSSVEIFSTSWSMYANDYELFNGAFPPFELTNTITHPTPTEIYSTGLSSAQLLPNGNTLICSGRQGYLVELNPDNEIVWEYKTPLLAGQPVDQGTELALNNNLTFSAFRYPVDYSAFDNRDLSSKGFIESMPNENFCDELVPTQQLTVQNLEIFPTLARDMVQISWDNGMPIDIRVVDLNGRIRLQNTAMGGRSYLDVSNLEAGLFFVMIDGEVTKKIVIQ